jgi:hypothetical protein
MDMEKGGAAVVFSKKERACIVFLKSGVSSLLQLQKILEPLSGLFKSWERPARIFGRLK